MATGAEIVAAARRYKGVTESPRGSNCNQFSHRLGHPCERWCGDYVDCVYLDCGINLQLLATPGIASCELALAAYHAKGWTIARNLTMPGDILLYQFDDDRAPDHTEIAAAVEGGHLTAIGGNSGHGKQANGGEVYEQARAWSLVMAVARVPGVNGPHPNPDAHQLPPNLNVQEDDMPGFLFSDGTQIWLTDGITRRRVAFDGDRFKELVFLGQARNSVDSAGNVSIPTNAAYLAPISVAA